MAPLARFVFFPAPNLPFASRKYRQEVAQTRVFCLKRATTKGGWKGEAYRLESRFHTYSLIGLSAESERNESGSTDGKLGVALLLRR